MSRRMSRKTKGPPPRAETPSHGFNTMIRGRVADEQLRRVTGHKTMAMTDNYDAPGIEHLQDVLEEQEKLFGAESDQPKQ